MKRFLVHSIVYFFLITATIGLASDIEEPTGAPENPTAGCAAPGIPINKFYVDPVHGTKSGDGSKSHPWRTLQEVVEAGLINGADPSLGKIHAGDVILLLSGNHGSPRWNRNSKTNNSDNTDFITIEAATGHTPVLGDIIMYGGSKWVFRGLTMTGNVTLRPVDDLIFTENKLGTHEDVTAWTPEDWAAARGTLSYSGNCATITRNSFKNVLLGIGVTGDRLNVSYNMIDGYANDAMNFGGNNDTVISHNIVINHYGRLANTNHNDAIQGWALDGIERSNLTIDSNYVMESTGTRADIPAVPTGLGQDSVQGISIFDGKWRNLRITNNIVAVSAYHGLSILGAKDALIAHNTIVRLSSNPKSTPWIGVFANKDKTPPKNVIVRNNISHSYSIVNSGVSQRQNLSFSKPPQNWRNLGILSIVVPSKIFNNYDPKVGRYDLTVISDSFRFPAGSTLGIPDSLVLSSSPTEGNDSDASSSGKK